MKRFLTSLLICPACLPKEYPLSLSARKEAAGDIISGVLSCRRCNRDYPIKDGIAHLVRDHESGRSSGQRKYEENETLNRYLWSHYADIVRAPDAGTAYLEWTDCLSPQGSAGFDTGCAVGRLTLAMANRYELAVGCDLSYAFIRAARKIAEARKVTCTLPLEGHLRETFSAALPDHWRTDNVEFVIADALALPFARETFCQVATLNLLDRVYSPLTHLFELNRVAMITGVSLLCSDPFSWSTANTPEENWLGGTSTGPYAGRGVDNVKALLGGKNQIMRPPWQITRQGSVDWLLRTHRNHCEIIHSQLLCAER
jgi:uncharacterized protein YbaR (Trm112 family)